MVFSPRYGAGFSQAEIGAWAIQSKNAFPRLRRVAEHSVENQRDKKIYALFVKPEII